MKVVFRPGSVSLGEASEQMDVYDLAGVDSEDDDRAFFPSLSEVEAGYLGGHSLHCHPSGVAGVSWLAWEACAEDQRALS